MAKWEDVDRIVSAGISARPAAAAGGGGGGGPLDSICSAFQIIRPILKAIEGIPFLPPNWRKVIEDFLAIMARICPSGGGPIGTSFREVDAAVSSAMAAHSASAAAGGGPINLGAFKDEFCRIYKLLKPILDLIKPFLPAAWQAGIAVFEKVADMICP
jgi:hypothetical protein